MALNNIPGFHPSGRSPSALRSFGAGAAILLSLFILAVVFWYTEVIGQAKPGPIVTQNADVFAYFYPAHNSAAQSLKAGTIPLWNPYQSCGRPLMATYQSAIFYPPNLLYLVLPTHLAMGFLSLFHIFLAGAFMYLFCRSLGMVSVASCFSALTFMLSTTITGLVWWPNHLASAVWIPLAFLCCDKIIDTRRPRWAVALGSVAALQILSGWLQLPMYSFYALCLYALVRIGRSLVRERDSRVLLGVGANFALAAALAVSLSAVQWLPTQELSRLSTRPPGSLSLEQTEIVGPRAPVSPATFARILLDPSPGVVGAGAYIGVVPLMTAFFFPFSKRRNLGLFFLFLATAGALLAFGNDLPFFKLFHRLPTGDWFRLPWRFIYLYTFALSILAGMGCGVLTGMARHVQRGPRLRVFGAVCLLASAAFLLMPYYGKVYSGLFLLLVSLLFSVRKRFSGGLLWHVLPALLLVLVSLDLFIKHSVSLDHPQANPYFFSEHKHAVTFLRGSQDLHRTYVGFHDPVPQTFGTLKGMFMVGDYEPLSLRRYQEFLEFFGATLMGPLTQVFNGGFWLRCTARNLRALRLLGTKYVMTPRGNNDFFQVPNTGGAQEQPDLRNKFSLVYDRDVNIYEMADVLPRAYLVEDFEVIREKRAVLEELAKDSFDPRQSVIIEEDLREPTAGQNAGAGEPNVIITSYSHNEVTISVDAPQGGILVLIDTYYPGWKASVDGAEVKIYRANYLFRAVPVRSGHHEVVFQYKPLVFRVGAWTTGVALLLVAITGGFLLARSQGSFP